MRSTLKRWLATALASGVLTTGAGIATSPTVAQAAASATGCTGTTAIYGSLSDGRLTYTQINAATNTRTKVLTGANLGFVPKTMATLDYGTILATTSGGTLYRIKVITNSASLAFTTTQLGTGWTHANLTYDGKYLYGNVAGSGELLRYATTGARTTAPTERTVIGKGFGTLLTLASTAPNTLISTVATGELVGYTVNGANSWTRHSLKPNTWQYMKNLVSPGGGLFYGHSGGALTTYRDTNPTNGSGTDITYPGNVDDNGWVQTKLSAQPKTVTCPTAGVTYSQLVAMFGSSRVGSQSVVEAGLPSLNAAMAAGNINTVARKSAFLATLVNESTFVYDIGESGQTATYRGRGYIQLTGIANYRSAGSYFGTDLVNNPSRASTLQYSAPIARWYWTVARPATNSYADAKNMGRVNQMIGFDGSSDPAHPEVAERCADFKKAYTYLAGTAPTNVTCLPSSSLAQQYPMRSATAGELSPGGER